MMVDDRGDNFPECGMYLEPENKKRIELREEMRRVNVIVYVGGVALLTIALCLAIIIMGR